MSDLPSTARRRLPAVLLTTGALLLGYVGFEYGNMLFAQRKFSHAWKLQQDPAALGENNMMGVAGVGLTRLLIPKIGLDAIVVDGDSPKALSLGPGHMENTALAGQNGNAVITAHRDTFFRHIYELNQGDVIVVQRLGNRYTYEVTGKKVVQPDDWSVTRPTDDAQLTLITCYPSYYIGPAPARFVVFSRLVSSKHSELPAGKVSDATLSKAAHTE
jgi:sortase A